MTLLLERMSNIDALGVFKNINIILSRKAPETEIGNKVNVGFEDYDKGPSPV